MTNGRKASIISLGGDGGAPPRVEIHVPTCSGDDTFMLAPDAVINGATDFHHNAHNFIAKCPLDETFKLPLKSRPAPNDLVDLERGEPAANIQNEFGICGWILTILSYILIFFTLPISACMCIKVVQEYERAVIFRLGRLLPGGAKGPAQLIFNDGLLGIFFVVPCIDTYRKVDLRVLSFEVPPQEILSKDSVTVAVDAVVYFRISNATISVTNVEDSSRSTKLLAQTTLRNILGTKTLAEMLSDREAISLQMQATLDEATEPWGVKVERVEVKDVRLPVQLQRAMAAEAEAAREARAKVIVAEGEQKASRALKEAAEVIAESPSALQLRYLQTLNSISAEKNSTIIFPFPIDLLSSFLCRTVSKSKPQASPNPPQRKVRACCLYKYPDWVQDILSAAGAVEGQPPATVAAQTPSLGGTTPANARRESSSVGAPPGSCASSSYASAPVNRSGTVSTASARDSIFRPSLTESNTPSSSQSIGMRNLARDDAGGATRDGAMSSIYKSGAAIAARQGFKQAVDGGASFAAKAPNTNTGIGRTSSASPANTQNVLLRKALVNRITRQPSGSRIPTPPRAGATTHARILLAEPSPAVEKRVEYEVPPDPLPLQLATPPDGLKSDAFAGDNVDTDFTDGGQPMKSDANALMTTSLLANAAWYRDVDGRTGFVPNEWRSAPNIQVSAIKKPTIAAQSDNSHKVTETQSDILWRIARLKLPSAELVSPTPADLQTSTQSFGSEVPPSGNQTAFTPAEGDGGSSTSEVSRHSHKSVTFSDDVIEIGAPSLTEPAHQNVDDELQSLLHVLRLPTSGGEKQYSKNTKETQDESMNVKHGNGSDVSKIVAQRLESIERLGTSASMMPPLPPPRSPKNIRSRNSKNRTPQRTIVRSASGYLDDQTAALVQREDCNSSGSDELRGIIRPNTLASGVQRKSSRSLQDQQASYYDNVTPPYASNDHIVYFGAKSPDGTQDIVPENKSESDDDNVESITRIRTKLPKLGRNSLRKGSQSSANSGQANPLLRLIGQAGESERRDSMLDSDSRESILSATSLNAERRVRRFFDY